MELVRARVVSLEMELKRVSEDNRHLIEEQKTSGRDEPIREGIDERQREIFVMANELQTAHKE